MATLLAIVIVDDHPVMHRVLRAIIEEVGPPIARVVGAAYDAGTALRLVETHRPDILLTDLKLGAIETGLNLIRQTRAGSPQTRILVLTGFDECDCLVRALQAGANGCVSKADELSGGELAQALTTLARGEPYWSPVVLRRLHGFFQQGLDRPFHGATPLTPREQEVLALVADGASNAEIAAQLSIGIKTVKTYVSNVLGKLHLQSRYEAAIYYRAQQVDRHDRSRGQP